MAATIVLSSVLRFCAAAGFGRAAIPSIEATATIMASFEINLDI